MENRWQQTIQQRRELSRMPLPYRLAHKLPRDDGLLLIIIALIIGFAFGRFFL